MLEFQIFLISFIASFIGLMIPGVASALSVSSLMLIGIPVQLAKTTYQIGNLGMGVGGVLSLLKTQKLKKDLIYPLIVLSILSGFFGGNILVNIPTHILMKLTGVFMIGMLLVNSFSKSLGVTHLEISKKRKFLGFSMYFMLNLFFSVFPMGTGVLYQFLHTFFFRVTNLEARLIGCVLSITFVVGFIIPVFQSGFYNITHIIIFGIGGYLGGYLGAKSSIKIGNTWLKKILMVWLCCLGIYFILFAS